MNKIFLTGNLTHDPELKATKNDNNYCTFSVAVNRGYKEAATTDYYKVYAWGNLGKICHDYLAKGRKVFVSGDLQPTIYAGTDGQARLSLVVDAQEVEFLSSRPEPKDPPNVKRFER